MRQRVFKDAQGKEKMNVEIQIQKEIKVEASWEIVFDVLQDMKNTTQYFPDLDELVELGPNQYRWNMKPIGVEKFSFQVSYACDYEFNREEKWIQWTTIKGSGNAEIHGKWTFIPASDHQTKLLFETGGFLELPIPRIFKRIAVPIVQREFEKSIRFFLENFTKSFLKNH